MKIDERALIEITQTAGEAILEVYRSDFEVSNKDDDSPLTQADLAAHRVIVDGLSRITPDVPIVSEESAPPPYRERQGWSRYWLVDPLDGTKEFVNRNGEFTVNIALIDAGLPVFGVVGVPVQDKVYVGDVAAGSARCLDAHGSRDIRVATMPADLADIRVVASRSHGGERLEAFLDAVDGKVHGLERKPVGSSLKLCVLAEGGAHFYPRLGPTSEWDIGAAHAVLRAAGGEVFTFEREVLPYNSKDSLLNPEFVAVGDSTFDWWSFLPERAPHS